MKKNKMFVFCFLAIVAVVALGMGIRLYLASSQHSNSILSKPMETSSPSTIKEVQTQVVNNDAPLLPSQVDLSDRKVEQLSNNELEALGEEALIGTRGETILDSVSITRTQDKIIESWPKYDEVREKLFKEINTEYKLSDYTAKMFVCEITKIREQFWKEGGDLSESSWKTGYKALLLAEVAYEHFSGDHEVVNQLIETMQSIWPIWPTVSNKSNLEESAKFRKKITEIRNKQFEQIKTEIANGRETTLDDFLCGADILYLTQAIPPENKYNIETLHYLQNMCRNKNWNSLQRVLTQVETVIKRDGYGYGVVVLDLGHPTMESSKKEPRYLRRLPSFRGPEDREAIVIESLKNN